MQGLQSHPERFAEYEQALRTLALPLIEPDQELRVFHSEPRRGGPVVGFSTHDKSGVEQVFYVEPEPDGKSTASALPSVALAGGLRVIAWQYPADPRLPALQAAVFPDALGVLCERMGLSAAVSSLELVGYRPGRRAVVRATSDGETLYVKVTRPRLVGAIVDNHQRVASAGLPTPEIVQWSPAGLIVFREAQGEPLTHTATGTLSPDSIVQLISDTLEKVATVPLTHPARAAIVTNRDWYLDHATRLYPGHQTLLREISHRIDALMGDTETAATVSVHGDLHAGQLFVESVSDPRLSAIIDLDGAGRGHQVDDLATFFAHTVATAHRSTVDAEQRTWLTIAEGIHSLASSRTHDYARWCASVATNLVGHSVSLSLDREGVGVALLEYCQEFLTEQG